eukprot:365559-Chlamydomonas_euryale.AAC.6
MHGVVGRPGVRHGQTMHGVVGRAGVRCGQTMHGVVGRAGVRHGQTMHGVVGRAGVRCGQTMHGVVGRPGVRCGQAAHGVVGAQVWGVGRRHVGFGSQLEENIQRRLLLKGGEAAPQGQAMGGTRQRTHRGTVLTVACKVAEHVARCKVAEPVARCKIAEPVARCKRQGAHRDKALVAACRQTGVPWSAPATHGRVRPSGLLCCLGVTTALCQRTQVAGPPLCALCRMQWARPWSFTHRWKRRHVVVVHHFPHPSVALRSANRQGPWLEMWVFKSAREALPEVRMWLAGAEAVLAGGDGREAVLRLHSRHEPPPRGVVTRTAAGCCCVFLRAADAGGVRGSNEAHECARWLQLLHLCNLDERASLASVAPLLLGGVGRTAAVPRAAAALLPPPPPPLLPQCGAGGGLLVAAAPKLRRTPLPADVVAGGLRCTRSQTGGRDVPQPFEGVATWPRHGAVRCGAAGARGRTSKHVSNLPWEQAGGPACARPGESDAEFAARLAAVGAAHDAVILEGRASMRRAARAAPPAPCPADGARAGSAAAAAAAVWQDASDGPPSERSSAPPLGHVLEPGATPHGSVLEPGATPHGSVFEPGATPHGSVFEPGAAPHSSLPPAGLLPFATGVPMPVERVLMRCDDETRPPQRDDGPQLAAFGNAQAATAVAAPPAPAAGMDAPPALAALVATEPAGSECRQCVVCLSAPADAGLLHGWTVHQCMCHTCAGQMPPDAPCPMCRAPVERILGVFL